VTPDRECSRDQWREVVEQGLVFRQIAWMTPLRCSNWLRVVLIREPDPPTYCAALRSRFSFDSPAQSLPQHL
jgi:hypothetical protein